MQTGFLFFWGFSMKSSEILHLVDEYINKYKSEQTNKYETIYRVPASDASKMGPEFIRDDKARVFFCFYRLPPEQYDDGQAQEFADAFFINGNSLRDGKIKLELNINMPVRVEGDNVFIDRHMMAELLTHELAHAYRKSKELAAGHYKFDFSFLNFVKRNKSNKKYTITQRTRAYDRTRPTGGTNDIYEKMRWVGYTMVEDEAYAQLAGIQTFLASGGNIKNSRGKQQVDIIKDYLKDIEKHATVADWEKCMRDISYIPARQNETLARFGRRWVAYYRNRISLFDKKVENLLEKYSPMKYRSGRNKIISNEKIKNTVRERQVISK